ncbi:hypothetical protein [Kordia periserrulae]|uniref:hypothetical protein n=1 Tax=Kordia periserrulae TaxID=701523 RepID=UPI0011B26FC7|nr:hypothetical protein [Kordia periserrulae]
MNQIKSEFLKNHWGIASEIYRLVSETIKYYDLSNFSSFNKSSKVIRFNNNALDLVLIMETFESCWNYYYKTYVLESMRNEVLDFFYKIQTGNLEEQVSAPYSISAVDIDYDLLNGFDLLATQSYLLYPYEDYKDFQPELKCNNQIAKNRKITLSRICEEVYQELDITIYDDLEETLDDGYDNFDVLITENKRQDYEFYFQFMRNCWKYTKGRTGSDILGFMFFHDGLRYSSLDDDKFSTNEISELKEFLNSKGIKI